MPHSRKEGVTSSPSPTRLVLLQQIRRTSIATLLLALYTSIVQVHPYPSLPLPCFTHLGQRPELRKRRGDIRFLGVEVEVADNKTLLLLLSHIWSKGVRWRRRRRGGAEGQNGRCLYIRWLANPESAAKAAVIGN